MTSITTKTHPHPAPPLEREGINAVLFAQDYDRRKGQTFSVPRQGRGFTPVDYQPPTKRDNLRNTALSASRDFMTSWIPACGGMTALLCALLLTLLCNSTYAAPPTEYEVKAAFIHNVAKFVEWPAAVPVRGTLRLCILGQPPFTEASALLQGKQIGGRVWEVRPVDSRSTLNECNVLFIAASESGNLRRILEDVSGNATLTVGDSSGYAARGVMVNFYTEGNKVRFEINVDAALRAGLKIGSQLLKLARIVQDSGASQSETTQSGATEGEAK